MYAILERKNTTKQKKNPRQTQQNCQKYDTGRYIKETGNTHRIKNLLDKENTADKNND